MRTFTGRHTLPFPLTVAVSAAAAGALASTATIASVDATARVFTTPPRLDRGGYERRRPVVRT
jgi:hypothetical protein